MKPTIAERAARLRLLKMRMPPDLATSVATFIARMQEQRPELNTSAALRMLLRVGLAADARAPLDVRQAGFEEGYLVGHGTALRAHQEALHRARQRLTSEAA
jgi:hypothetical protein